MDGAKEGTGELSTAWGRGGPQVRNKWHAR
jgi:hypothetical protein